MRNVGNEVVERLPLYRHFRSAVEYLPAHPTKVRIERPDVLREELGIGRDTDWFLGRGVIFSNGGGTPDGRRALARVLNDCTDGPNAGQPALAQQEAGASGSLDGVNHIVTAQTDGERREDRVLVDVHAASPRQPLVDERHVGDPVAGAHVLRGRVDEAWPEERELLLDLVEPRVVEPVVEHGITVVVEDDVVGPHVAHHAHHAQVVHELEPASAAPHVVDGVGREARVEQDVARQALYRVGRRRRCSHVLHPADGRGRCHGWRWFLCRDGSFALNADVADYVVPTRSDFGVVPGAIRVVHVRVVSRTVDCCVISFRVTGKQHVAQRVDDLVPGWILCLDATLEGVADA